LKEQLDRFKEAGMTEWPLERYGLFVTWGDLKKQELSHREQLFVYGGGGFPEWKS
jgi:hypothetical protein